MIDERWLPIMGSERWQISDHGRVMSPYGKLLKPFRVSNTGNRQGSLAVDLGRLRRAKLSHLVLEHFVEARPDGMIARHLDDDGANCHYQNLCWGTYSDNMRDAYRNGRRGRLVMI